MGRDRDREADGTGIVGLDHVQVLARCFGGACGLVLLWLRHAREIDQGSMGIGHGHGHGHGRAVVLW